MFRSACSYRRSIKGLNSISAFRAFRCRSYGRGYKGLSHHGGGWPQWPVFQTLLYSTTVILGLGGGQVD